MLRSTSLHRISFIKNVLIIFNVFFAITGLLIIRTGNSVNHMFLDFSEFLVLRFFLPSALIVTVGFILFVISCISCYGVHTENYNLINVSCIFFALVLILEAVFGCMIHGQVKTILANSVNETLHDYAVDPAATHAIDTLQNKLHCCGVRSSQDWAGVLEPTDTDSINLPNSCCAHFNEKGLCESVKNPGCLPVLEFLMRRRANILATLMAFILFIQTLGLMFSYSLVSLIRQQNIDKHNTAYNEFRENLVNYFQTWQIVPTNEKS